MRISVILLAAALGVSTPAAADSLFDVCGQDIEELCTNVEPGDGRIAACLYAHSSVLSDECHAATEVTSVMLERVFDLMQATYAACREDIETVCADVHPGGGRVAQCLKANSEELSVGCAAGLDAMPGSGG